MTTEANPPAPNKSPLIRASELTQYGFCQRAWWLGAVKGETSINKSALAKGVQTHRSHANKVRVAFRWRYAGLAVLSIGCFLFIMTIVFSII
jgi:hypothetical protein